METYGQKTECGTVACAAGFCGMDPWFRRRGWKMDLVLEVDYSGEPYCLSMDPSDFFGRAGCKAIFWNTAPRPVGTVIREVKTHIKELRKSLLIPQK